MSAFPDFAPNQVKIGATMENKPVSVSDFVENIDRHLNEARAGQPALIESHGKLVGAFISIEQLVEFQRLKRRETEVLKIGELPEDLVQAIEAARYGE